MAARIYRPAKSANQSGMARTKQWLLVFEQDKPREIEPLMGWTAPATRGSSCASSSTRRRRRSPMREREGIAYRVEEPNEVKRRTHSYSDNFKFNRVGPWTH